MKKAFVIAAPMSGSGKTTVSRALMALCREQGLRVQPFKCGPDYIDTKFHAAVCGRPSVNLDTFMADAEHVRQLFHHYGKDADVCIVEGMMGLFDGYDRDRGSTAEIASVLGLPVVLVVDARSAAYSVAPLLHGMVTFRPGVNIAGVIFNKVGSARHEEMLRQACADAGLECLGCLPRSTDLEQASRYLCLDFSQYTKTDAMLPLLKEHLQWPFDFCASGNSYKSSMSYKSYKTYRPYMANKPYTPPTGSVLVARNDEAFSFIYQQTLDRLAPVTFFNPETDVPQLDGCQLLYLPGGYPEKHLAALVAAEPTRRAIREYACRGGRIVAECGGMMYLCRSIITDEGTFPMCGVLPYDITARQSDRRLSLGYRCFTLDGHEYRGHEFHYTQFAGPAPTSACTVYDAKGRPTATPVIRWKNVLASYTHLYPDNPAFNISET